jgi:hypothetical protein
MQELSTTDSCSGFAPRSEAQTDKIQTDGAGIYRIQINPVCGKEQLGNRQVSMLHGHVEGGVLFVIAVIHIDRGLRQKKAGDAGVAIDRG